MNLTPEEKKELDIRPIPSAPISRENLQLRRQIAIKLQAFCLEQYPPEPEMLEIYNEAPMWKFYKTRNDNAEQFTKLRVYGACLICGCHDEKCGAKGDKCPKLIKGVHTASAHIMFTNLCIDGRPVNELVHYDEWPAEDESFIRQHNNEPAAFLDPCGFAAFFQ